MKDVAARDSPLELIRASQRAMCKRARSSRTSGPDISRQGIVLAGFARSKRNQVDPVDPAFEITPNRLSKRDSSSAVLPGSAVQVHRLQARYPSLALQPVHPRIYLVFEPTNSPTAGPSKFDRLREFTRPHTSEKRTSTESGSLQNFR